MICFVMMLLNNIEFFPLPRDRGRQVELAQKNARELFVPLWRGMPPFGGRGSISGHQGENEGFFCVQRALFSPPEMRIMESTGFHPVNPVRRHTHAGSYSW
jgi:hypothetical protein